MSTASTPPSHRRRVVGVMGSGSEPFRELSEPLGEWLAVHGYDLLTGGGGGVMEAVSRAFFEVTKRTGVVIGILPGMNTATGIPQPIPGYPNRWVELPIATHLPLSGARGKDPRSRNHINVLSAAVIIALPGGEGTRSEVELAVQYDRPVLIYHGGDASLAASLISIREVPVATDLETVTSFIEKHA